MACIVVIKCSEKGSVTQFYQQRFHSSVISPGTGLNKYDCFTFFFNLSGKKKPVLLCYLFIKSVASTSNKVRASTTFSLF